MKLIYRSAILFGLFFFTFSITSFADVQRVYDEANILTEEQVQALEKEAQAYYEKWNADFIILTTEDTEGKSIEKYMGDYSDELAEEFERADDNMAILTFRTGTDKEVYIAGFGLAEEYIHYERVELILDHVAPLLSNQEYFKAFQLFFEKTDEYLNIRPSVNPESIFLNTFFQLAVALGLAGVIVFFMAYTSGGRVTTTSSTYLDQNQSRIISKHDRYLRKTVTRRKKPSSNNGGGGGGFRGGGGGGITGGGRSFSGSGRRL